MDLTSMSVENAQRFHNETGIDVACDADEKTKAAHLAGCATNGERVCAPLYYHLKAQKASAERSHPGQIIQIRERFTVLLRPGIRFWHVLEKLFAA